MGQIGNLTPGVDVSLEAVLSYASDQGISCFATDAAGGGEYRAVRSDRGYDYRRSGRPVAASRDSKHRARIKAPFRLFGHFAFSDAECADGIFWCLDLLRAGYVVGHVPTAGGARKIWLIAQVARNGFRRLGLRPQPRRMRSALRRLAEHFGPGFRTEPHRILMITSTYNRGGSERQLIVTAAGLIERGYDVRVLALGALAAGVPDVQAELRRLGIKPLLPSDFSEASCPVAPDVISDLRAAGLPSHVVDRLALVLAAIRELRPSVVHGWVDVPAVIAAVAACHLGVPRVVVGLRNVAASMEVNGYPRALIGFVREGLRSILANPAVVTLANCSAVSKSYERWLGLQPGTIHIVKNGYETGRLALPSPESVATFRAQFGWSADVPAVGSVMRFARQKDPDLWLDTAAEIAKRKPAVRFLIAGFGELEHRIRARIDALGLTDRVVLLDAPADLGLAYAALDAVLMTSLVEGIPNVLIEAQVAGRPVVTVDAGGAAEAISVGRTGHVVADRSAQELAAAVIDILDNPAWASRARTEGPAFVASSFDADRMVEETLQLYGPAPSSKPEQSRISKQDRSRRDAMAADAVGVNAIDVLVTCYAHTGKMKVFPEVRGYYLAQHLARSGLNAAFRELPVASLKCRVLVCSEYEQTMGWFDRHLRGAFSDMEADRMFCLADSSLFGRPDHYAASYHNWFRERGGVLVHRPSAQLLEGEHWIGLGVDPDVVRPAADGVRNRVLFDFPNSQARNTADTFDVDLLAGLRRRFPGLFFVGTGSPDARIRGKFDEWIAYGHDHQSYVNLAFPRALAVIPGCNESMGLAMAEAQVAGACIISAGYGPPDDMLVPEAAISCGRDTQSLAAALSEASSRNARRIRESAIEKFDFRAVAARTRAAIGL